MLNLKKIFLALLFFSATQCFAYEPTNTAERERLASLIKSPGFFENSLKGFSFAASSLSPYFLTQTLDFLGSKLVGQLHGVARIRQTIEQTAFAKDNLRFAQYDDVLAPFRSIPEEPVKIAVLDALLERAYQERLVWENGKMSGAIYDGSEEHMAGLADYFIKAILRDDLNSNLFIGDEDAQNLAKKAFQYFNTANPLHGTTFALAVKAMRELGAMFAALVEKEHAIVSSGGREALRIGLRALKNARLGEDSLVFDDENNYLCNVFKTINVNPYEAGTKNNEYKDFSSIGFAAIYLTDANFDKLQELNQIALTKKWGLHVHLSRSIFEKLITRHDPAFKNLFTTNKSISSISFDSETIIYGGVAATIFADVNKRFMALESHVDWVGGMYPGINAAGSIAGIDYILSYLMILYHGRNNLAALAELQHKVEWKEVAIADRPNFVESSDIVNQFFSKDSSFNFHQHLEKIRHQFSAQDWRTYLENILVDLNLSLFSAPTTYFTGRMTSGGTESIRLALQTYHNVFRARKIYQQPIFLMTDSAHVAFERHIKDLDGQIVRIRQNAVDLGMDIDDLRKKINEYGSQNIGAIIASTPSYPFGAYDDIRTISSIANEQKIPLHVDSCLGGYMMQFMHNNPLALDFGNEHFDGVTSWSADLHKYGLSQKGLSFVGFRRSFVLDEKVQLANIANPRSASQLELGISCLLTIGREGYEKRAANIANLGHQLNMELSNLEQIEVRALPAHANLPHFVVAFRLKDRLQPLTYVMAAWMKELGWHLSQVGEYTVHMALTNAHTYDEQFVPKFLSDLNFVIERLALHPGLKKSSSVGVYGMAADFNVSSLAPGHQTTEALLNAFVKFYAENLISL
jgi:glutamate/tyrosine decarboxylase-like PLP-dependent enzyme